MKEAIEDSRWCCIVSEELPPVFDGAIWRKERTFSWGIPIQDNFQQIVGCLLWDFLSQEQIIDDQEVGFGEEFVELFPSLKLSGFEEVLEEAVSFPVNDFIAWKDGGVTMEEI